MTDSFLIQPADGPLAGYEICFDTFEHKTVEKIQESIGRRPNSLGGAWIRTGTNMGYLDKEDVFIKSGDIEVIFNHELRIFLAKICDIRHGNIKNQMIKLAGAPHKHKALLICGRFWYERLIKEGWNYVLGGNPPAQLLEFFSFARKWLKKGIHVYWLSDVSHLLDKMFELVLHPPIPAEVEFHQYTTRKVMGTPFAKELQQIDGITYEFAAAISEKWPTPAYLNGVPAEEIAAVMHEVDIVKAKIKKRTPRTFKALPLKLFNHYTQKGE